MYKYKSIFYIVIFDFIGFNNSILYLLFDFWCFWFSVGCRCSWNVFIFVWDRDLFDGIYFLIFVYEFVFLIG